MIRISVEKLRKIINEFEEKENLCSLKDTFSNGEVLEVIR